MNNELFNEACEELGVQKHCKCNSLEHDCLLSLGYGKGDMSEYCSKEDLPVVCEYRSEETFYPEFTSTKQIELVKFFMRQQNLIIHYIYTNNEYGIAATDFEHHEIFVKHKEFTDALLDFTLQVARLVKDSEKPIVNTEELSIIIEKV